MFLESQKQIEEQRAQNEGSIRLRCFKPKLISSLNYEQEYLIRRKQKRNKRHQQESQNKNTLSQQTTVIQYDKSEDLNPDDANSNSVQNNFYKEVYDGNDKISGYWVNGLLEGDAQIQYNNGDYFKGKFEKGYKTDGLMIFKDQGSYQGCFYSEQFHGKGVLRLKEKTISAYWNNGLVQGSCVVEYQNGNVYYGPLKQFKKHGYGYLYFPNDSKFFGQFVDGIVRGYGEYFQKGKLKCKGLWQNGKLIQEKKEGDLSFNFEEENINWTYVEGNFEKTDTKMAGVIQMLFNQANGKMEDDEKFKQMLQSIKQSNLSNKQNKSKDMPMPSSESSYQSQSDAYPMSIEGDAKNEGKNKQSTTGTGIFGFLNF